MNVIIDWAGDFWEFVASCFTRSPGTGPMRAATFVRYAGAFGLGHVAWAFDYSVVEINAGSVENPGGKPSCDVADMGYWDAFSANPIPTMTAKAYSSLKYVELKRANSIAAYRVAKWIATQPYTLFGRNCLDDTYDVLRAYGVSDLPAPSQDLLPDAWFGLLSATFVEHVAGFVWSRTGAPSLRQKIGAAMAKAATPKIPTWRRVGHRNWHDLQNQLAAARKHPPRPVPIPSQPPNLIPTYDQGKEGM